MRVPQGSNSSSSNGRLRVAYIVPSLDDTTGWGRWVNDFLRHIQTQGVQPVLYAPPSSAGFRPQDLAAVPAHFVLPELFDYLQSSSGIRQIGALWALRQTEASEPPPHLVHSLDAHPWGLYGDLLARRYGIPHVLTTHGRYGYIAENRLLDRILYGRVLRRAARMIAVSNAVRQAVARSFERSIGERLTVLQNPVDGKMFETVGTLPDYVPADGPVLVSVTRFTPVKDLETAVRAFHRVRQKVPDATYFIIGPGNGERNAYYRAVRDVIAREQIEGVHIIGRVGKDVLSAFYQRASMLVHTARTLPDDFEASGLILLEAGLFGLPVVASASGGIAEVVEDGGTGRLVPEADPDALAEVIVRLLGDPVTLARYGENNRRRAGERNWPAYCVEQMRIYAALDR